MVNTFVGLYEYDLLFPAWFHNTVIHSNQIQIGEYSPSFVPLLQGLDQNPLFPAWNSLER